MADDVIPFPLPKKQTPPARSLHLVQRGLEDCRHRGRFEVDEAANTVMCLDCKADLSPTWVLVELSDRESLYMHNYTCYVELKRKIDARLRTKCEHCNRVTRIGGL